MSEKSQKKIMEVGTHFSCSMQRSVRSNRSSVVGLCCHQRLSGLQEISAESKDDDSDDSAEPPKAKLDE